MRRRRVMATPLMATETLNTSSPNPYVMGALSRPNAATIASASHRTFVEVFISIPLKFLKSIFLVTVHTKR
jgi:hypothetical protein